MKRQGALQGAAFMIILLTAAMADGLMDTLGPLWFVLVAGSLLAVAGVLVWLSYR